MRADIPISGCGTKSAKVRRRVGPTSGVDVAARTVKCPLKSERDLITLWQSGKSHFQLTHTHTLTKCTRFPICAFRRQSSPQTRPEVVAWWTIGIHRITAAAPWGMLFGAGFYYSRHDSAICKINNARFHHPHRTTTTTTNISRVAYSKIHLKTLHSITFLALHPSNIYQHKQNKQKPIHTFLKLPPPRINYCLCLRGWGVDNFENGTSIM